jgi:redox-sensitive bicupin YhaK (pirin superfamily)
MIEVRRAKERRHDHRGQQETWLTFNVQARADPLPDGFNSLQILNECRLPPGGGSPTLPHSDTEIITYVLEGSLAYDDSLGRSGVMHAGEFRRMTAGRNVRCTEKNASRGDWARIFQLWLRSRDAGVQPGDEQKRFSTAQRRGGLCLVASPDGRLGSLHLREDALVYSALLERGQHIVHDLQPGRGAWLHVVNGEVTLGDDVLGSGDGAGISAEPVSFTAREETEILLLDLVERTVQLTRVV